MFVSVPEKPDQRPLAPAKQRILETADVLFTREGIRAVGVDWLIEESHVTKATFYKHFRAKDRLVLDYLADRHRRIGLDVALRLSSITDAARERRLPRLYQERLQAHLRGQHVHDDAARDQLGDRQAVQAHLRLARLPRRRAAEVGD